MVRVWWHGAGLGGWALQGRRDSTQSRALVGQLSARTPAQAAPASPGLQGWPLPVASHATGAGWRRAALVTQGASARVRRGARRSGGASLSSPRAVRIASHSVLASPARTEPGRASRAGTWIRTWCGSLWSARATCTICVASQHPTATGKSPRGAGALSLPPTRSDASHRPVTP
jgi:hypothetical protein